MKKFLAIALSALLVVAMAVPASAAIQSKTQSTDPHVKQQTYNGKSVDFVLYDEDGNPIEGLEYNEDGTKLIANDKEGNQATYELVMYSYADMKAGASVPSDIASLLEKAYAAYQAGAYDSVAGSKVLQSIVYIGLKKTDAQGNVSYVGATDIKDNAKITVNFTDGYTLAVTGEGTTVAKASDGSYVKFGDAGVFALFKDQGTGGGGGTSPQTGYESQSGIVVAVSLVAALVAVVGVCYVADKKRA